MRFLSVTEQRYADAVVRRPGPLTSTEWALVAAYLETAPATSEEEWWALQDREQKRADAAKAWRLTVINELAQFGMMDREMAHRLVEQEEA